MHGSVFYCVANMPGAVPHTSTYALTNATLPYVLRLAERRLAGALAADPALAAGLLSTHDGALTSEPRWPATSTSLTRPRRRTSVPSGPSSPGRPGGPPSLSVGPPGSVRAQGRVI